MEAPKMIRVFSGSNYGDVYGWSESDDKVYKCSYELEKWFPHSRSGSRSEVEEIENLQRNAKIQAQKEHKESISDLEGPPDSLLLL